ncbi:MAG: tRNA uridine-5-carboxymethylaminomethyl(34) synthesis GTPase MnmE [Chloroflexota bacterium]|nr:tRNA uridine-5-carboxymethylaminomethyl(34) synthesis GTPase MnmE [Chloroflexota bacterium]
MYTDLAMYNDTIAAISTPLGEGGIGIVRLSGPDALAIVETVFPHQLPDHRFVHGHIIDPDTGEAVDEVMVCYMAAPHTYTAEDVVEIDCHGGVVPLQRVLELAFRHGARSADPGEFTLRAFLNGRIDLAQAESVLDIIHAKTEASLRIAMQGLEGNLSRSVKAIRIELMNTLAYLTARIDFPEDEIDEQDIVSTLENTRGRLQEMIDSADSGIVYRHGVKTAIVGRRNVGKSSLLNRLLRQSRAIVSPVPGTTRDTLEEVVNIKGVPFVLIDTAGLAKRQGLVESLGAERSRDAIAQADFVLLVIDAGAPLRVTDRELIDMLNGKTTIIAANKSDLPKKARLDGLPFDIVEVSAMTGEGIEGLEAKMLGAVFGGNVTTSNALLVSNPRHKACLKQALGHLDEALASIEGGLPDDFVTIDLTATLNAVGEITGETVSDELLEIIFSNFCIGK